MRGLPERNRYLRGSVPGWATSRSVFRSNDVTAAWRASKYSLRDLIGLALDGAFSVVPLRIATALGALAPPGTPSMRCSPWQARDSPGLDRGPRLHRPCAPSGCFGGAAAHVLFGSVSVSTWADLQEVKGSRSSHRRTCLVGGHNRDA